MLCCDPPVELGAGSLRSSNGAMLMWQGMRMPIQTELWTGIPRAEYPLPGLGALQTMGGETRASSDRVIRLLVAAVP